MIQAWLLRQVPWIVVSLAVIGSGWAIGAWLKEKGREELRPEIARLQSELAAEQAARIRNEEAMNAYQTELDVIRRRPVSVGPVRLCVPAAAQGGAAAEGADGAASAAGSGAGADGGDYQAGPDIGDALMELAFQCDAENAKLRALQGWVRGLE